MNTPTHLVISLAAWAAVKYRSTNHTASPQKFTPTDADEISPNSTNESSRKSENHTGNFACGLAAVVGAILPDAPMFWFYGIEKFVVGSTESEIWQTRYFLRNWQDFFDLFNSIPLACLGLVLAGILRNYGLASWRWLCVLMVSVLLHCLADLPLHHDDGHRHFWPILQWRFESPLSYWDPQHHGILISMLEYGLFLICTTFVFLSTRKWLWRTLLILMATIQTVLMLGFWWYVLTR